MHLALPSLLSAMIANGRWPRTNEEALSQNVRLLVGLDRVHRFAPEEDSLYLELPPFKTVREESHSNPFWSDMAAPDQIDFDRSLILGDFGLGSDAPILLDYRPSPEPRVIRLRWGKPFPNNHWIEVAPNFETFIDMVGL